MPPRSRSAQIPELFLGLLAIGVAVVLMAHIFGDTVRDVRHSRDTVQVTGSAKKPITANLVRWTLTVNAEAPTAPPAVRRLLRESAAVRSFLRKGRIEGTAISSSVVTSEKVVERLSKTRTRTYYRADQQLEVSTRDIDAVESVSPGIAGLIADGIDVSARPLAYLSTELTQAKLDALDAATQDARKRAEVLVHGLGGKLGRMRASSLGVYQVTPRDSTDVSDYGISDTSSREKDVNAVVSATFAVNH
ncbi:MAG TPA: SIMPL domain-containing protein [Gaiellaceae bacterium]|nr:SIMPL domain-containing protein [Gaiellaceae bacterium]